MSYPADELLEQPVPEITTAEATEVAARMFGAHGDAHPLDSERDRNFLIRGQDGPHVLKFANPAESSLVLSMEAAALEHIASTDPDLPVPRPRRTIDGQTLGSYTVGGTTIPVRMVSYLLGATLQQGVSSVSLRRDVVTMLARLELALRGFFHPAAGRVLLWDLAHLAALRPKLHHVEPAQQPLIEHWLNRFDSHVAPRLPHLRAQIIHNDFNPDNLLVDPEEPDRIAGIIDFGDMVHGPLVVDLAVAIAYQILGDEDPTDVIADMAAAYHELIPLESGDLEVLPDLVVGRLLQSLVIAAWRVGHHEDNTDYILAYSDSTWLALRRLSDVDADELVEKIRRRCRLRSAPSRLPEHELIEHRERRFGPGLRLSYAEPVHAASAEGVWIFDAAGDRFLDAYNNVPHVGHSNPTVTAAIARQAGVLNTNTRYLVDDVVAYADRLIELLPDQLEVVLFANSGSEANDLAWRIARTVTGNQGFVITRYAYHGSTYLTMATSPEEFRHEGLEPWVATVPAPDTRRGRDAETGEYYAGFVPGAVEVLGKAGHRPAAFICDTIFASDGIYDAPSGYFEAAAGHIRRSGGLFIADEVQGGFGRVGERMWGFAQQGVVPDIVTLGKPMGNGHPVAAVVTSSEIAEAFTERGYYFSTFAGNSVSAAAGMAVLDVMEAEHLPAHAERVGAYLRGELRALASRHPSIGDVRGAGLFVGVELVSGDQPDPDTAEWLVNQLRRRHVLIGRTGLRRNVLKIRPPLVFDESHADMVVEALDATLSERNA